MGRSWSAREKVGGEAERERGREEGERINWVSVAELENFASVM